MSDIYYASNVVSSWLSYTMSEGFIASLDEEHQTQLRAKFRRLVEETLEALDGISMSHEAARLVYTFARVLLKICEVHRAWWSFELLIRELEADPEGKYYRAPERLLPLLDDTPAAVNALYWARKWAEAARARNP